MKRSSKRLALANAFGALGYLSAFFQWVWALLLLLYPLLLEDSSILQPPEHSQPSLPPLIPLELSPLLTLLAVIIVVLLLVATVITIIRLPASVGKGGRQLTHSTAAVITPTLPRYKSATKQQRQRLSYRVVLVLKLLIVTLPLAALFFVSAQVALSGQAIWLVGVLSAALSCVYFGLQQLIAWLGKVPSKKLW